MINMANIATVTNSIAANIQPTSTTSDCIQNSSNQSTTSPLQESHSSFQDSSISHLTNPPNASQDGLTFKFAPFVPIQRRGNNIIFDSNGIVDYLQSDPKTQLAERLLREVLPEDSIVEAPSLVTPLLLKKRTIWPTNQRLSVPIPSKDDNESASSSGEQPELDTGKISPSSDDVQVIKVVENSAAKQKNLEPVNNLRSVDEYIKAATMASLASSKSQTSEPVLAIKDYFRSSVGGMLLGIGLSRVNEFLLDEKRRRFTNKLKKMPSCTSSDYDLLESMKKDYIQARCSNKAYKPERMLTCPRCPFTTESYAVLQGHLEVPHMKGRDFICNWCDYRVKDTNKIATHYFMDHKKRCRIEKSASIHQCRFCPYEGNSKKKMMSHLNRCERQFPHDSFLGPEDYYGRGDYPALTSKLITKEDVHSYEQRLKAIRLAAYNPHQIKTTSGSVRQIVTNQPVVVVTSASQSRFAIVSSANQTVASSPSSENLTRSSISYMGANRRTNSVVNNPQQNLDNSTQLLKLLSAQNSQNLSRPAVPYLQHPRVQSAFKNGTTALNGASYIIGPTSPAQHGHANNISEVDLNRTTNQRRDSNMIGPAINNAMPNPKGSTFVICEICDGYIQDLAQLKSHMQLHHKVKIHHKLESRPPLNCQKCQWRFFTDQGLERHLLGVHGLVTSNMQELVENKLDSGRCTVCGQSYASQLVDHMKTAHQFNLKPAHLSYKCTVCSATFNLYRLFENHVYSVHTESVRRNVTN